MPTTLEATAAAAAAAVLDPADAKLYEVVASRVTDLIDRGTLRVGQRVPSVRKMSRQLAVSVSTVLQAYRLLEDRGRIEARPQSGYYVRPPLVPVAQPAQSRPPRGATRVTVGDLVVKMLQAIDRPGIIPLGGAVPPAECLPVAQLNRIEARIARNSKRGIGTYCVTPGAKELRVQVARRYLEAGCALAPDDVVTTCGCQEALGLCARAVAKPGDVIAIESPTYYGHLQLLEALGIRAREVSTSPETGICLDALADALKDKRVKAVLLVTNCQNPLGHVMPEAKKVELVRLLARHDVPLIEDDIYGDLAFGPARPKVCKAFDRGGSVLLCSSFSKTLAPGARVGWCAPGRYYRAVERLKACTTIATPTLPQLTIAEFLASGGYDHHLRKVRRYYHDQVRLVSDAVRKYFPAGTKLTRPAGGHVLWVEMPEGVDGTRLHERALADHSISIAPGVFFSATNRYKHSVRLNCGCPFTDEIDRAILTLGRLAEKQLRR